MSFLKSIRFRLSITYSAVVFGLGGALLGLVYMAIRRDLRGQTITRLVVSGQPVMRDGVRVGVMPRLEAQEMRTIESFFSEWVLNRLTSLMVIALVVLFLLSVVVGWILSGRALRPVAHITDVAREISASDLGRRINLQGPDDELTRLAATFDGMLDRLDRAFSSQRQFLADTSHDLRTPLAVIQSNVELAVDDPETDSATWREVAGIVTRNVKRMSEMIEGLLSAARLQVGKAQAVRVDLARLVEEAVGERRPGNGHGEYLMETSIGPAEVDGVAPSLVRALANLIDNAIAVSEAGDTIRVGCGLSDGWAWLAVSDQGPGLDPDELRRSRSTGLGLGIAAKIAEAHGGTLSAYRVPTGGTTMVVWLPAGTGQPHPEADPLARV